MNVRPRFNLLAFTQLDSGREVMSSLLAFKKSENKQDPERRFGLHGPYEELTLLKTGSLPPDYYTAPDPEPWGLRVPESRSGIMWQVLSGMLDRQPEFGAAYLSLAMDLQLSEHDYAAELKKLHKDFRTFMEHAGILRDHQHGGMGAVYRSVSCPACSIATALAIRDPAIHTLFREMIPLSAQARKEHLETRGFMPLLNQMITAEPAPGN